MRRKEKEGEGRRRKEKGGEGRRREEKEDHQYDGK